MDFTKLCSNCGQNHSKWKLDYKSGNTHISLYLCDDCKIVHEKRKMPVNTYPYNWEKEYGKR